MKIKNLKNLTENKVLFYSLILTVFVLLIIPYDYCQHGQKLSQHCPYYVLQSPEGPLLFEHTSVSL